MFGRLRDSLSVASDSKLDSDDIDIKLDKLLVSATSFPEHDREAEDVVFVKVKKSSQGRRCSVPLLDDHHSHHITDDTHSMNSSKEGGEYSHHEAPYIFYEKKPQPIEIKELVVSSLPMYESHPEHKLTIVHMSDSHKSHQFLKNIPEGDVFIHSGDISHKSEWREITKDHPHHSNNSEEEPHDPIIVPSIVSFNEWLGKLPHPIKIVVFGNHDMGFEDLGADYIQQHVITNAIYLQDQQLVVKYKDVDFLRIFGSPWTVPNSHSSGMGFTLKKDKVEEKWEQIPRDTDLLVTHSPPFGIMDLATCSGPDYYCEYCGKEHKYKRHWGCSSLRNKTIQLNQQGNLRAHFFGHVHDYHGTTFEAITQHSLKSLLYSNASSVVNHTDPRIKKPIVVELKLS